MSEYIEPFPLPEQYRDTRPQDPKRKRSYNTTRPERDQAILSKAPFGDGARVTLDDIGVDKEWRVWVNPNAVYPGAASNPIPVARIKDGYYHIPLHLEEHRMQQKVQIPKDPDRESFEDLGFVPVYKVD